MNSNIKQDMKVIFFILFMALSFFSNRSKNLKFKIHFIKLCKVFFIILSFLLFYYECFIILNLKQYSKVLSLFLFKHIKMNAKFRQVHRRFFNYIFI
jgi:hypothetical protein